MDYIGRYVKKYESGNKGSLCLDSCGYDWGLSTGSYQLTLRWGNCIKFLRKYFPKEAAALYFNENAKDIKSKKWPGQHYCSSPEDVEKVWRQCYEKVGGEKFFQYEHEYIKNQYYDRIKKKIVGYIDLDKTCRAFQEMFWSWSVNAGVNGCYNGVQKALKENNGKINSFESFLDSCYDVRYKDKGTNRYKKGLETSERETLRLLLNEKGIGVAAISSSTAEIEVIPQKTTSYQGVVTGNSVYIRERPNKNSKAIKIVRKGDRLKISAENDGWGHIPSIGWISLKYVEKL